MANLDITNSFSPNTVAASGEVNTNFTDIETWLNNRDNGTDTWLNVKVSATAANPVDITGSAATTELSINNSAADGDPILSFELSGTAAFTLGVDDGDSDKFKIGTTAIGTSTIMELLASAPHVKVLSADAVTELAIDNTAADGDPVISFELSGTAKFTMGVDDGDSDIFKIGTTAIGTSTNLELDGTHVFFPSGTAANPGIAFIAEGTSGVFLAGAGEVAISRAGVQGGSFSATRVRLSITDSSVDLFSAGWEPTADNAITNGTASLRWSDTRSVLINGADYGFLNGWFIREYPATFKDVQTRDEAWFKENANLGLQFVNDAGELVMVIGRDGTLYADQVKKLADLDPNIRQRNISSAQDKEYERQRRKEIRGEV